MTISSKPVNNSLNPVWRRASIHLIASQSYPATLPSIETEKVVSDMTFNKLNLLRELDPSSGAYLNEVSIFHASMTACHVWLRSRRTIWSLAGNGLFSERTMVAFSRSRISTTQKGSCGATNVSEASNGWWHRTVVYVLRMLSISNVGIFGRDYRCLIRNNARILMVSSSRRSDMTAAKWDISWYFSPLNAVFSDHHTLGTLLTMKPFLYWSMTYLETLGWFKGVTQWPAASLTLSQALSLLYLILFFLFLFSFRRVLSNG